MRIRQAATPYEAVKKLAQQPGLEWMLQVYGKEGATFHELYEKNIHWSGRAQGPGVATAAIIAIVMSCVPGGGAIGAAGGLAAGGLAGTLSGGLITGTAATMCNVAAASLLSQFTTGMLSNRGNISQSLKKINLVDVAVAAASAGIFDKVCEAYKIAKPDLFKQAEAGAKGASAAAATGSTASTAATTAKTAVDNWTLFRQYLVYNAAQMAVNTTLDSIRDPHHIGTKVRRGALSALAQTLANFGAAKIGQWRAPHFQGDGSQNTGANYGLHKAFHAGLGYASGSVFGLVQGLKGSDLHRAGFGGALGAVAAEVIAASRREEVIKRTAQRFLAEGHDRHQIDQKALQSILNDELRSVRFMAEMGAVGVAGAFNCNPNMASSAAVNAIENNLPIALPALAVYEIIAIVSAGGIIWGVANNLSSSKPQGNSMDAVDPGVGWVDEGITTEEGKVQIISTPIPSENEVRLALPGFDPVPEGIRLNPEGFSVYDGPDLRILESNFLEVLSANAQVSLSINKNSLKYIGETHVYVIRDFSGKILKYGESAMGINALGQSKRAQAQARKLERMNAGQQYTTEIIQVFNSKLEARISEARYIDTHRRIFGKDSLPLNKNKR